jgi:DNA-directed RNA polymerase specialized sigma24 family protein
MWVGIAESTTCGYGERVQTSSDGQRTPNAVTRYLDIEKEIKSLEAEQKRFIGYIERLPVNYYDILHKIYVQNMTPKQVQLATGSHYSTITSAHSRAKKSLKELIEGEENV